MNRLAVVAVLMCACASKSGSSTGTRADDARVDAAQADRTHADGARAEDAKADSDPTDGASEDTSGPARFETLFPLRSGQTLAAMVVDEEYLYMNKDGILYRGNKAGGGTPEPVAGGVMLWGNSLAIDGNSVYWFTGRAIMRLDTESLTQTEVYALETTHLVMSLAMGNQRLYLVAPGCVEAFSVSVDGTDERTVTREESDAVGGAIPVAVGADSMYCSSGLAGTTPCSVYRWSNTGDTLQALHTMTERYVGSSPEAMAMVEVGLQLYVVESHGPGTLYHRLLELPLDGGTPKVLAELTDQYPSQLHYDPARQALYWVTIGEGHVVKYDLVQRQLQTRAIEEGRVRGRSTADDTHLYWANQDAVVRMAKF